MQKHLEFTVTIWSSEIAPRVTFFNLKSCKRKMTVYDTEEDDRNDCNKYVCYKSDALWPYWRSVGTFAIHVAICCNICEKESNSVEMRAKGVSKMFANIRPLCSDAEWGRYQELVQCILNSKY